MCNQLQSEKIRFCLHEYLPVHQIPDSFPDLVKHLNSQASGLCVLAAGMVRADQVPSARDFIDSIMSKDNGWVLDGKHPQDSFKCYPAQHNKYLWLDDLNLAVQDMTGSSSFPTEWVCYPAGRSGRPGQYIDR